MCKPRSKSAGVHRNFSSPIPTMASSFNKKRKREALDSSDSVAFTLSGQPASQIGPVLSKCTIAMELAPSRSDQITVSYPTIQPSKSTPFNCYIQQRTKNDDEVDQEFASQPTFVAGEADSIEFFSSNESQKAAMGCRCVLFILFP